MSLKFTTAKGIEPSFSEKAIAKLLNQMGIRYFQEVMFDDCRNPSTGAKLRYDFYLPDYNAIIEYDGKEYHSNIDVMLRDDYKNSYAKKNNIKMVRIVGLNNIKPTIKHKFSHKPTIKKAKAKKPKPRKWEPIEQPIKAHKTQAEIKALLQVKKDNPLPPIESSENTIAKFGIEVRNKKGKKPFKVRPKYD